jgi:hypothetical protein
MVVFPVGAVCLAAPLTPARPAAPAAGCRAPSGWRTWTRCSGGTPSARSRTTCRSSGPTAAPHCPTTRCAPRPRRGCTTDRGPPHRAAPAAPAAPPPLRAPHPSTPPGEDALWRPPPGVPASHAAAADGGARRRGGGGGAPQIPQGASPRRGTAGLGLDRTFWCQPRSEDEPLITRCAPIPSPGQALAADPRTRGLLPKDAAAAYAQTCEAAGFDVEAAAGAPLQLPKGAAGGAAALGDTPVGRLQQLLDRWEGGGAGCAGGGGARLDAAQAAPLRAKRGRG